DITIAKRLQSAGYRTGLVGKWGLGDLPPLGQSGLPNRMGFDEFFGYLNHGHAHNYYPSFLYENETKLPLPNTVPKELSNGAGVSTDKVAYAPDRCIEVAEKFIKTHQAKPFFLYFASTIPHANNEAGEKGMEIPSLGAYANADRPLNAKAHAAMVTRLDADVGRLIATLKQQGILENTLILFSSDNGPHKEGGYDPAMNQSNGPLRGWKRDLYEGGIRVPTLARGPGIPAGAVNHNPWAFWDVMPTVLELAGLAPQAGIDGHSQLKMWQGQPPAKPHEPFYWEFHEKGFKQAVRMEDWKAVRLAPGKPLELYNLKTDLGEKTDVAEKNPEVVAKFETYLKTARTESAEFPIRVPMMPK
ncbi:MAG: sulfatase-like hydrolase/transferase, partial [Gemmataceae bacterium]